MHGEIATLLVLPRDPAVVGAGRLLPTPGVVMLVLLTRLALL